jgi:hypothetical protein
LFCWDSRCGGKLIEKINCNEIEKLEERIFDKLSSGMTMTGVGLKMKSGG